MTDFTPDQIDLIKKTICPKGTTDEELKLFIYQCKRTGLDPFTRQIYLQERRSKNKQGEWESKKNVQVSIDGFRIVAQRSGEYRGQVGPYWCGEDGQWQEVWLDSIPPLASKVGVWREGFKEPLWAVARWESYVQGYGDKVSPMWAKMPDLMLSKVAEALALRKAFPNDLSNIYAPEEMDQIENEHRPKEVQSPKQTTGSGPQTSGTTNQDIPTTATISNKPNNMAPISIKQQKELFDIAEIKGIKPSIMKASLEREFGIKKSSELQVFQWEAVINTLNDKNFDPRQLEA